MKFWLKVSLQFTILVEKQVKNSLIWLKLLIRSNLKKIAKLIGINSHCREKIMTKRKIITITVFYDRTKKCKLYKFFDDRKNDN